MNKAWDKTDFLYADKHQKFALVQLHFTYFIKNTT